MGMQLPSGLRNLFYGLTGSKWFTADETTLRALADLLDQTGGRIETEIPPLVTSVKRRVRTTFDSRAADYFEESIDKFTAGNTNYVKAAADAAHQLADFVREAANQVEYVKWMIIGQLIQLALEIAWAIAMAKWTFGASLTMIPVFERIASLAIQQLLRFLFNTLLVHLVVSVTFAMTMDQLIQRAQIAKGNRKGNDDELSTAAGVGGVFDGLFSAGFSWLGGRFADWITDNFGGILKNYFKIEPDTAPSHVGGRGPGPEDLPGNGAPSPKIGGDDQLGGTPTPKGGRDEPTPQPTSGGGDGAPVPPSRTDAADVNGPPPPVRTPETVPPRLADDMADALARNASDLARPFGRNPRPWDNVATTARFRDDVGKVFESNLGDRLGRDAARDLGRNYADTFIANWGTRDIGGSLARVLDDAPTGLGGRQLSPETRAFLSQTLPEGTAKGLTEFADNWRRTAAHFGTNVAEAAGSNYLGEGFSNMVLSEDHKFDANGMSAVAGAANVALTTGGVLGGIKGLDALENLFGSNTTVDAPPPPVMESDSVGAANDSEASTGGGSTGGSGGTGGSGSGGGPGAPGRGNGPEGGEAQSDADTGPGTPEAENADLRNPADSPGSGDVPDTDERVRPVPPPDVPSRPEVPVTARDGGDPTVEPPSGASQGQDTGGTDAPAAPPPRMEDPSMSRFEDDGGDTPLVDGPSGVVAPPDTGTPQDVTDTDEVRDHPFDVPVAGDGFTGAPSAMTGTPPPAQGGDGAGASRPGSTPRGEGTASQAARTQAPSSEADAPSHSPDAGPVRTTGDTDSSADSNRIDTQSDPDRPMTDRVPESDPERVGSEVADGPHEDTTEAPRTPSPLTDLDELGGLYDDPPAPSRTESEPVDLDDPWRGNPPRGLDLGALQDPKGGKDQPPTIGEVIADLTEYRYALDDVLPSPGDTPALSVNLADRFHYRRSYDDGFADYDDGSNGQYPTPADDGEIFDFSPSTSPTPQGGGGYGGYPSRPTSGHPSTHQGPGDRAPIDGDWTLDDLDDQSSEDAFYHSDESDAAPAQPVQRNPHPHVPGIPTHNPFLSGPAGTGLPPVVGGLLEFDGLWGVGTTAPRVRTFADNAEAIGFGRDHWDGYVQDLPEREADAVRAYTAAGTYRQMNTALRSGGRLDSETRQYIRRMDRALAGRPVPEDVMVTRGMGISHLPMSPQDMVDQGTRFHERGYLSTALGRAAPSFDNNEAVLYMRIPAGTPAIWMERLSTYGVQERELVLGRDLEWSIVDAVHRDGQWHMMVEVAPDSLPAAREGATTSSRFDGNGGHHDSRHDRTGGDQHGGFTDSGGRIGQRTAPLETGRTVRFDPPEVASAHPPATRSADPVADRTVTAVTRTPVPETAGAPMFGPPVNHRPGDPAPRVADLPGSDQWGQESKPQVRRFSGPFADTLKPPADAPPLTVEVNTEKGPMRARVRIQNLFFESTTREIHREGDDDGGPSSVLDVKLRVLSLPAQSGMDKQAQAAASRALNQHVEAMFNDKFVLPRGGRQLNVTVVPVTSGTLDGVHAWVSWSPAPSAADGSPPPALGPDTDGRGIGEVLRRLGMLDGDPVRGEDRPYVARRTLDRIETMVEPRPARRWVDPQSVAPAQVHTGLVDPSVWEGTRAGVPVHQVGGPNVSAALADPGIDSRAARPLDIGPGGDPVDPATVVDNPDARSGDPERFVKAEMNPRWAARRFEWARIPIPEEKRTQGGPTHALELTFRPRIHRDEGTTTPEQYETYLREYTATLDAMWNRRFRIRGDGTVVGANGTRVHKLGDDLFNTLFGEGSRPDLDDMEVAGSVSGTESPPPGSGDQLHIRILLADDSTPDDQVHHEIYLASRPGESSMDTDTWNALFPVEAGVHETAHLLGLLDEYFDSSTVFRGSRDANAVRSGDDDHGYGLMGNGWLRRGADGRHYKHRDPVVLNGYLDTITSMVEHGTSDHTRPPRVAELSAEVKSDILRILDPGLTENDPRRFEVFERFSLAVDVFARGTGNEQLVAPGDAAALGAVREQLGVVADARAEARREGARAAQARALGDEAGARAADARAGELEAAARAADVRASQARARATDSGVDARLAQARAAFEAKLDGWRESGRLARAMDLADRNGVRVPTSAMIDVLPGAMRGVLEDVLTDSTDLAYADALAIFAAGRDHIAGRARIEDIPGVQGRTHITAGGVKRQIDQWRGEGELIDAFIVLADSGLEVTGREWIGALPEGTKEGVARRLWSGSDPALGGLGLGLDRGLDQAGLSHVALEVFSAGFDQMLYRAPARELTITVPDGSRVQVTATQVYEQLKAWRKQGTLADVLNILRNSGVVVPDDVLARASTRRAGQRTVPVRTGRPVPLEPPDVVSAKAPATVRIAPPPPADHNDVLTVPFARSKAALSEAGRSEIKDFAHRRVNEAYWALLHNRQLPATEVRGHGSRAGASDTAGTRGEQVSSAYKEFVQKRDVHKIGIIADDLVPTVLAPSRGQGGKETDRSAELRTVAPPAPRIVVGAPGDSGRQVPRILHMNWFHGKIPEASAQNMRDWVARAAEAGWTVRLWTDDSAGRRNRALFSDLAGTIGDDGLPVVEVSTSPADALGIKGGARELHDFATEREVWPMQSDIVRYHALVTHGGMHVDSDIGPGTIDLGRSLPSMGTDSVPMLAPLLRDQEQENQVQRKVRELGLLTGAGEAGLPTPARYQWRLGDFNNNLIVAPPGSRFLNEMISGLALTDEIRNAVPRPLPQLEGTQAEQARGVAAQFTGPGKMRSRLASHIAAQDPRQVDDRRRFGEFRKGNWKVDPRYTDYLSGVEWVTADSADYVKYVATDSGSGSDSGGGPVHARTVQAPGEGRRDPATSPVRFTASPEIGAGTSVAGGSTAGGTGRGGRVPRFLLREPAPVWDGLPTFYPRQEAVRSEWVRSYPFVEEPDGAPSRMNFELDTSHGRMRADVEVHRPFFDSSVVEVPGEDGADSRYVRQVQVRLRVRVNPKVFSRDAATAAAAALKQRIEALFNGLYVLPHSGDQLHVSVEPAELGQPYHADVIWYRVPPEVDGAPSSVLGPADGDRGTRDLLRRLGLLDHDPTRGRGEPFVARQTLERIENAAPIRDGLSDFDQNWARKRKRGDADPRMEGRWFSRDFADALKLPDDAPPLSVEVGTGRGRIRAKVAFDARFFLSAPIEAVRGEGEGDQGDPASFRHVLLRVRAAAGDGVDEPGALAATMQVKRYVEELFNRKYVLPRSGEQLHVSVVVLKSDHPLDQVHATLTWSTMPSSQDGAQDPAPSGALEVAGIGEVLRRLGMLDGDPARGEDHPYVARRTLDRIETMAGTRPPQRWADPQGEVPLSDHEHKVVGNPAKWRGAGRDEWEIARAAARVHQVGAHVSSAGAEIQRSARAARPLGENDFDAHGALKNPAGVVAEGTVLGVPRFVSADMKAKWVAPRRFEHRRIPIPERYRGKTGKDGPTHVREITFRVRPIRHSSMTKGQFDAYLKDYAKKLDAMFNGRFRLRGDGSLLDQSGAVVHRLGEDLFETLFGRDSVRDPRDLKGNEITVPGTDPLPGTGDQLHVRLELAKDTTPSHDLHATPIVRHYEDAARSKDMPGLHMMSWHDGYPVEAAVHETAHWLGLMDEYFDPSSVFRWRRGAGAVRVDGALMTNSWTRFSEGRVRKVQDPTLRTRYADTIASVMDHGTSDYAPPRWAHMKDEDKFHIVRLLEPGLSTSDPRRFKVFDRFALVIDVFARGWGTDRVAEQFVAPADAAARGAVREQMSIAADARVAARREGVRAAQARASGEDTRAREADARAVEFEEAARAADARATVARKHSADSGADSRVTQVRAAFEAEFNGWRADGRLLRAMDTVMASAGLFDALVPSTALIRALPPGAMRSLAQGLSGSSDPGNGNLALSIFAAGFDRAFGQGPFTDIPAGNGHRAVSARDVEAALERWRVGNTLVKGLRVFHDHGARVWGRKWIGALPEAGRAAVVATLLPVDGPRQNSVLDGLGPLPRPVLEQVALDVLGERYDQHFNGRPLRGIKVAVPGHPDVLLTKDQVDSQLKEWATESLLVPAAQQLARWYVPTNRPGLRNTAPASTVPPRQQMAPGGAGAPAPFTADPHNRPAEFVPAQETEGGHEERGNPVTASTDPADLPEPVPEPTDAMVGLDRAYLDPEPVVGNSDPRRFVPLSPDNFDTDTEPAETTPGPSVREATRVAPQDGNATAPTPPVTSGRTPPATEPQPSLADSWGGVLNPKSRTGRDGSVHGDAHHQVAPSENGTDTLGTRNVTEPAESSRDEDVPTVVGDPDPVRERTDAEHERELARARRGKRPDPAAAERLEAETLEAEAEQARLRAETERDLADESAIRTAAAARDAAPTTSSRVEDMTTDAAVREDQAIRTDRLAEHMGELARRARLRAEAAKRAADRELDEPTRERPTGTGPEVARAGGAEPDTHTARTPGNARDTSGAEERAPGSEPVPQTAPEPVPGVPEVTEASHGQEPGAPQHPPVTGDAAPKDRSDVTDAPPAPSRPAQSAQSAQPAGADSTRGTEPPVVPPRPRPRRTGQDGPDPVRPPERRDDVSGRARNPEDREATTPPSPDPAAAPSSTPLPTPGRRLNYLLRSGQIDSPLIGPAADRIVARIRADLSRARADLSGRLSHGEINAIERRVRADFARDSRPYFAPGGHTFTIPGRGGERRVILKLSPEGDSWRLAPESGLAVEEGPDSAPRVKTKSTAEHKTKVSRKGAATSTAAAGGSFKITAYGLAPSDSAVGPAFSFSIKGAHNQRSTNYSVSDGAAGRSEVSLKGDLEEFLSDLRVELTVDPPVDPPTDPRGGFQGMADRFRDHPGSADVELSERPVVLSVVEPNGLSMSIPGGLKDRDAAVDAATDAPERIVLPDPFDNGPRIPGTQNGQGTRVGSGHPLAVEPIDGLKGQIRQQLGVDRNNPSSADLDRATTPDALEENLASLDRGPTPMALVADVHGVPRVLFMWSVPRELTRVEDAPGKASFSRSRKGDKKAGLTAKRSTNLTIGAGFGAVVTLLQGTLRLNLPHFDASYRIDAVSTRALSTEGAQTAKAHSKEVETYEVERVFYAMLSGDATLMSSWGRSIEQIAVADARRMAGLDEPTDEAGALRVPRFDHLAVDRPAHWGGTTLREVVHEDGSRYRTATPANGATNSAPRPTTVYEDYASAVLNGIADEHPGMVVPDLITGSKASYARRPGAGPDGHRTPRELPVLRRNYHQAIANTIMVLDAMTPHNLEGRLEEWTGAGIDLLLIETTSIDPTLANRGGLFRPPFVPVRLYADATGRVFGGTSTMGTESTVAGSAGQTDGRERTHTWTEQLSIGLRGRDPAVDAAGARKNVGMFDATAEASQPRGRTQEHGVKGATESTVKTTGDTDVWRYGVDLMAKIGKFRKADDLAVIDDDDGGAAARARDGVVYDGHAITIQGPRARLEVESPAGRDVEHVADRTTAIHQSTTEDGTTDRTAGRRRLSDTEARAIVLGTARPPAPHPMDGVPTATSTVTAPDLYRLGNRLLTDTIPGFQEFLRRSRGAHDYLRQLLLPPMLGGNVPQMLSRFGLRSGRLQVDTAWRWRGLPTLVLRAARGDFRLYEVMPTTTVEISSSGEVNIGAAGTRGGHSRSLGFSARFRHNPNDEAPPGGGPASGTDTARSGHPTLMPGGRWTPYSRSATENTAMSVTVSRATKVTLQGGAFPYTADLSFDQAAEVKKDWKLGVTVPRRASTASHHGVHTEVPGAEFGYIAEAEAYAADLVDDAVGTDTDGTPIATALLGHHAPRPNWEPRPGFVGLGHHRQGPDAGPVVDDLFRRLSAEGLELTGTSREELFQRVGAHIARGLDDATARAVPIDVKVRSTSLAHASSQGKITFDIIRGRGEVDRVGAKADFVDSRSRTTEINESRGRQKDGTVGGGFGLVGTVSSSDEQPPSSQTPDKRSVTLLPGMGNASRQSGTSTTRNTGDSTTETVDTLVFGPYAVIGTDASLRLYLETEGHVIVAEASAGRMSELYPAPYLTGTGESAAEALRAGAPQLLPSPNQRLEPAAGEWAADRRSGARAPMPWLEALSVAGDGAAITAAGYIATARASGWQPPQDVSAPALVRTARDYLVDKMGPRAENIHVALTGLALVANFAPAADGGKGLPNLFRDRLATFADLSWRLHAVPRAEGARLIDVSVDSAHGGSRKGDHKDETTVDRPSTTTGGATGGAIGSAPDEHRSMGFVNDTQSTSVSSAAGASRNTRTDHPGRPPVGSKRAYLVAVPTTWLVAAESPVATTRHMGFSRDQVGMAEVESEALAWVDHDQARELGVLEGVEANKALWDGLYTAQKAFGEAEKSYFDARQKLPELVRGVQEAHRSGDAGRLSEARAAYTAQRTTVNGLHGDLLRNFEVWNTARAAARESLRPTGPERTLREAHPDQEEGRTRAERAAVDAQRATMNRPRAETEWVYTDEDAGPAKPASTAESTARPDRQVPPTPVPSAPPPPPPHVPERRSSPATEGSGPPKASDVTPDLASPSVPTLRDAFDEALNGPPPVVAAPGTGTSQRSEGGRAPEGEDRDK